MFGIVCVGWGCSGGICSLGRMVAMVPIRSMSYKRDSTMPISYLKPTHKLL